MKFITVILLFAFVWTLVSASSGYIENAKGEDCSSGNCVEVCSYDGLNLLPGTEEANDGKCRRVRCNKNFSVDIKHCLSMTTLEKCKKWVDNSKLPFPQCCDKICKH
ncbi:unnamed protein product [Diamesa serratosioi]